MNLLLYVEDSYHQSYEKLAQKWLNAQKIPFQKVRSTRLPLLRMRDEMLEHVELAQQKGYNCVVFVVDREIPKNRPVLVQRIEHSFKTLCKELPRNPSLANMKVSLVVAESCLECWILADAEAVKRFACRRGKQVRYTPRQIGNTEKLTPQQASNEIAHILQQVARQRGKKKRRPIRYDKSSTPKIIAEMSDLAQAQNRNNSLKYFLRAVTCQQSGCKEKKKVTRKQRRRR